MIPDKTSDIKPRFHRPRTHSIGKSNDEVSVHVCVKNVLHYFMIMQITKVVCADVVRTAVV